MDHLPIWRSIIDELGNDGALTETQEAELLLGTALLEEAAGRLSLRIVERGRESP